MKDQQFYELATKQLSNKAGTNEKDQLSKLLENEEYYRKYKLIKKNWEKINYDSGDNQFNVEEGLSILKSKIVKYEPEFKWQSHNPGFAKNRYRYNWIRAAASIAFITLLSAFMLYQLGIFDSKAPVITWNEKQTVPGQKSILTLFDGTKITLNAESSLRYPTKFGEKSREVHLNGEAYFEVVHKTERPFVVHTNGIKTTVLGTKFNISAFKDERDISVSLVEGAVSISADMPDDKVLLKPAQQFLYNKENNEKVIKAFDALEVTGWKDNILIFNNIPLENVFVDLHRAFGVEFELSDESYKKQKIKANLNNESFWAVVEVIKFATGLNYKTITEKGELKKVIFY